MAITNTLSNRVKLTSVFTETGVSQAIQVAGPGFDVSIAGVTAGGGTVVVQRCYDAQITASSVFRDVKSYTADAEETGDHQANIAAWYRFSVTYVGGTVTCALYV